MVVPRRPKYFMHATSLSRKANIACVLNYLLHQVSDSIEAIRIHSVRSIPALFVISDVSNLHPTEVYCLGENIRHA